MLHDFNDLPRVAITGHRDLYGTTRTAVDTALREKLRQIGPVVGVSCVADGADALFAAAVLDTGGFLVAIVPAAEYRQGLPSEHWPEYDRLLSATREVTHLDHTESTEQSHMDASVAMLDGADRLIAVWDGKAARGFGGTADVVEYAQGQDIEVSVIWPEGAQRGK